MPDLFIEPCSSFACANLPTDHPPSRTGAGYRYRNKSDRPLCGMMDSNLFGLLPDGGRLLWGVLPLKQVELDHKKNVSGVLHTSVTPKPSVAHPLRLPAPCESS